MGPMESLKSALAFTRGLIPKEEPMRKQALLLPESFTSFSLSAKASEERILPSGVKTQNQAPLGIFHVNNHEVITWLSCTDHVDIMH